jgi:phosphoribosylanthranilate isomerase
LAKIKICGLSRPEDILAANAAGPDYIGFVFARSKRQVSFDHAKRLRERLKLGIVPVGVFVLEHPAQIARLFAENTISIAQLHGGENERYIRQLRELSDVPVISSVRAEDFAKPERIADTLQAADYWLLDSGAGSGKPFVWETIPRFFAQTAHLGLTDKPWFFAGGIYEDNLAQALAYNPFAVDISSGAETDGYKDPKKIRSIVRAVRKV